MSDSDHQRVIIPTEQVSDKWKPYATILNFSGVTIWAIVTIYLISFTRSVYAVGANQTAYLGLIVPTVTYGILSLVAGTALVNLLNPWFNFVELMKGDGMSKLAGAIIWAGTMLSIAFIIMGVR